jgi:hypothetical protein
MIGRLLLFTEFNTVLIRPIAINVVHETMPPCTKISILLSQFSFPTSLTPQPEREGDPTTTATTWKARFTPY